MPHPPATSNVNSAYLLFEIGVDMMYHYYARSLTIGSPQSNAAGAICAFFLN